MSHECVACGGQLKANAPGVDLSEAPFYKAVHPEEDAEEPHEVETSWLCSPACMVRYLLTEYEDGLPEEWTDAQRRAKALMELSGAATANYRGGEGGNVIGLTYTGETHEQG